MDFGDFGEVILPSDETVTDAVAPSLWELYLLWLRVSWCLLICFVQFFIELPLVILFKNWDITMEIMALCAADTYLLPHFRGVWNTYVVPNLPRMQVYKICEHPGGGLCLLTRTNNLGRWGRVVSMLYHPMACGFVWSFSYVVIRGVVYPVVKFVLVYLLMLCRGM